MRSENVLTRQPDLPGGWAAWYFMRLSGLLLLGMALFHMFYLYFWQPGGIDGISYQSIVARWTDPALGFTWRVFDLLLLVLGLMHGGYGIWQALNGAVLRREWQLAGRGLLLLLCIALTGIGAAIIFTV